MLTIRKAADRGHFQQGWLDTYHSFSFGGFHDPEQMGFRSLRVINEDVIDPGQGFGTHPHQDLEIVTWVLSGALEHRDSLGNGSVLLPGEVQRMTAGSGVTHSEFNPSPSEPTHLYQIWILPDRQGLEPAYEQRAFDPSGRADQLLLVASPDGREGSLTIHQDTSIHLAQLSAGREITHTLEAGRHAWLQVFCGSLDLNGIALGPSDGVRVSEERALCIQATEAAQVLLFDLN